MRCAKGVCTFCEKSTEDGRQEVILPATDGRRTRLYKISSCRLCAPTAHLADKKKLMEAVLEGWKAEMEKSPGFWSGGRKEDYLERFGAFRFL